MHGETMKLYMRNFKNRWSYL